MLIDTKLTQMKQATAQMPRGKHDFDMIVMAREDDTTPATTSHNPYAKKLLWFGENAKLGVGFFKDAKQREELARGLFIKDEGGHGLSFHYVQPHGGKQYDVVLFYVAPDNFELAFSEILEKMPGAMPDDYVTSIGVAMICRYARLWAMHEVNPQRVLELACLPDQATS